MKNILMVIMIVSLGCLNLCSQGKGRNEPVSKNDTKGKIMPVFSTAGGPISRILPDSAYFIDLTTEQVRQKMIEEGTDAR